MRVEKPKAEVAESGNWLAEGELRVRPPASLNSQLSTLNFSLVLFLPLDYVLGMLVWIGVLAGGMAYLLKRRRRDCGPSPRPSPRGRGGHELHAVHAGLSLLLVLAILTAAELCFALFYTASDSFNMTNVSKRWFYKYVDAQRNEQGFRDVRELTRKVPRGVRRVCFLGDSFTVGHGVEAMSNRFSDILGDELEKVHPGEFIVANLADPGNDVSLVESQAHALIKERYDVDMIVYVVTLNDIEFYDERTKEVARNLESYEPGFFLFSKTYFLNWLYFRFQQVNRPEVRNYYSHLEGSYTGPAWLSMQAKLDELNRRCREADIELRMVIFPFVHNVGPDYPFGTAHRQLVNYCEANGIRALDLEPVFREHAGENLTVNRFDAHPNERAHRIAAEAMRESLLDDLFGR